MSVRFPLVGTYGDIYNFPTLQYKNALKGTEGAVDEEEGIEEDVMEEVEGEGSEEFEEFIEDEDESEDEDSEDEEEVEWLEEGDVDIEESDEDIEDAMGGIDDDDEDDGDEQPHGSDDSDEEAGRPKKKPSECATEGKTGTGRAGVRAGAREAADAEIMMFLLFFAL